MPRKKHDTKEPYFIDLPGEGSPDYFRTVVRNCITAYSKLFNDKLALDYNKVIGKTRALVLSDMEYQRETRSIYSRKMWEEVDRIERLVDEAGGLNGEETVDDADPRNRGRPPDRRKAAIDKDVLNMQFKAMQARREILNLSASDEKAAETDAVNLMYVALTRDEFARLQQVELFQGIDNATGVFGSSGGASKEAPSGEENKGTASVDELYTTDENGDIVEL